MPAISLGPFDLHRPIGRGGMGEVWLGVHLASGAPVAVKVLTGAAARDPAFRRLFRDEIRAVAALDHPGIVRVFDTGTVDRPAERASEDAVQAGSPWLAMELVSGGSLADRPLPSSWAELRAGLAAVLDALAHAHARGVIHRDLKPGNVLVAGPDDARPGLKLTDFGLAFAMDRENDRLGMAGTPQYMAPEQFRTDWRETGPWTDLYAVGCATWEQLTGEPPFTSTELAVLAVSHALEPLPDFRPQFPVPAGLDRWLLGLLAKRPVDRVARAADAARQLASLPEAPGSAVVRLAPRATPTLAVCLDPAIDRLPPMDVFEDELDDLGDDDFETEQAPLPVVTVPFPASWAVAEPTVPPRLVGAGLGLYGLRDVHLIGRRVERDALWDALRSVYASGVPRVVVLRGARGVGKSRLGEWLCQRADELALAEALKLSHSPVPGARDGLIGALWRALRLGALGADDRKERATRVIAELGGASNEIALVGSVVAATESARVTQGERWGAFRSLLRLKARRRPVILWVQDAAHAADALAFAETVLTAPLAALVVIDADDEEPTGEELARLEASALTLTVPPLGPEEARALAAELGLEEGLAARVAERSAGNPLFAVQLVRDWVQRGALVVATAGFALAPGEIGGIPDDLHALWSSRVTALGPDAQAALEVAATLGQEFEAAAWNAACTALDIPIPPDLVDGLLQSRLGRRTDDGYALGHALLRESLLREIPATQAVAIHRACAAARAALPQSGSRTAGIGAHLVAAGELEAAFDFLIRSYHHADAVGNPFDATSALALAERALGALKVPDTDGRWSEVQVRRALLETAMGLPTEGYARAVQAEWSARRTQRTDHLCAALRLQATCANMLGRFGLAEASASEALLLAREANNADDQGVALNALGDAMRLTGRLDEAIQHFQAAAALGGTRASVRSDAWCGIGACRLSQGELGEAEQCYRRSLTHADQGGSHSLRAAAWSGMGDVARRRGRFEDAAHHYREAVDKLSLISPERAAVPTLNLGLVHLATGNYAEARALIEDLRPALLARGRRAMAGGCSALLALCAASGGDADTFGRLTDEVATVRERGFVDVDIGWAMERAGDLWEARGQPALAHRAWTEAAGHVVSDSTVSGRLAARLLRAP